MINAKRERERGGNGDRTYKWRGLGKEGRDTERETEKEGHRVRDTEKGRHTQRERHRVRYTEERG